MSKTKDVLMHRNGKDQYGSHRDDEHVPASSKKVESDLAASRKSALKQAQVLTQAYRDGMLEVLPLRSILDGRDGYCYEDRTRLRWAVVITWTEDMTPPHGIKRGSYTYGSTRRTIKEARSLMADIKRDLLETTINPIQRHELSLLTLWEPPK